MTFKCPRRAESHFGSSPAFLRDDDYDPSDDSCQYCGSLNPDTFMARLEAGDVLLGSTDKNYKVYVENSGGEQFKQSFRDCPRDKEMIGAAGNKYMASSCQGPDTCTHWVTREIASAKFYFQHLGDEQQKRFIELFNEKRIKFSGNYGFYVLPFFCTKVTV
jgi:ferredoxin